MLRLLRPKLTNEQGDGYDGINLKRLFGGAIRAQFDNGLVDMLKG